MIKKVILGACCVLVMTEAISAQLSELRYSRLPLPGVSDISQVGIVVEMGSATGLIPPTAIIEAVQPRLETLGYRVALAPTHSPEGLWLQIDCRALSEKITSPSSKDGQLPSTKTRRLSPPCQLAYIYQQEVIPWKNVDRLIYTEGMATMGHISQIAVSFTPQECVKQFFTLYDFPVLLAAEWGHVDRLAQILNQQDTSVERQRLILALLGETQAAPGYPILLEKLQDVKVAKEAAEALGFFGLRAQKHLLPLVQNPSDPILQAAAAKGLGRIAAATGNSQYTPLQMKMVADVTVDIRVRTQLVWALGKAPDMRSYSTLLQLEQHMWNDHSQDPDLQEFREAVDWTIRQVKQGGHGDDF